METATHAIEAINVSKAYGQHWALREINIKIPSGKTFALVGPNGAGKTTFVKSLLGLVHFQSGELKLQGKPCSDKSARESVGYLPEKFQFYPFETITGVLNFYGRIRGLKGTELSYQRERALNQLQIEELAKRKLRTLSKGQLQRLGLAALLMGKNDVLILDEPFSGLDPIGIKDLKELIKVFKQEGRTLLINSHILAEMEQICDYVGVINKGQCLFAGPMEEVKQAGGLEDFFYRLVKTDSAQESGV